MHFGNGISVMQLRKQWQSVSYTVVYKITNSKQTKAGFDLVTIKGVPHFLKLNYNQGHNTRDAVVSAQLTYLINFIS